MPPDSPDHLDFQPVFLIGAARSGTKIVRDVVALHPDVSKVPYDINFIWRLGNEGTPHDELTVDSLSSKKRARLRQKIGAYHHKTPILIEKTVSNCLRVPFVHTVFPEAKFIFLVRDGCDVIESVYRQWVAPPEWRYILKKTLTYPIIDAFGYALAYSKQVALKLFIRDHKKLGSWGPRYRGIGSDIACKSIIEVCAIQWSRSIQSAFQSYATLEPEQMILVRYEDFVIHPLKWLNKIAQFMVVDPIPYSKLQLNSLLTTENIGKGQRNLRHDQKQIIQPYLDSIASVLKHKTFSA